MDDLANKTEWDGAHKTLRHRLASKPYRIALLALLLTIATPKRDQSHSAHAQAEPLATNKKTNDDAKDASDSSPKPIVRVEAGNRVTLHVSGLPLAEALRMLSEPTHRNIILADGADGTVSASLYNVSFSDALNALLISNGLGYREEGAFIYVYPLKELAKLKMSERKIETRVFRLSYMNANSVKKLIENQLSDIGKVAVTPPSYVGLGGDSGLDDTKGDAVATTDALVVTDYVDKLAEIESIIKQLDVRPKQVLVEATILRATLNEDNALGIDFTTVGGIDFQRLNSTSPGVQSIATGGLPPDQLDNTSFTVRTDFNSNVPSGGFTFGVIKNQIGLFIRALEQITDTDILANPKMLALNKQAGEIIVGRRDGFITTTITATTTAQTIEFLETGTILTFRPFIGDDGYIRMEIHPKDSTGGLTTDNLPFEQTTEVTTNILVKDGRTILIGGLFREVSTARRGQVPLLGDLPIAGALFRTTGDNTVREEVIVLLTVHIIKDDADTKASEELAEDIERHRVGMRTGLQWFGRERLAQLYYEKAMKHAAEGDVSKALWDARLAVHNYPRHVHAAKLIEKLEGRRDWESEASIIRTFIRDQILEEKGIRSAPYGRPSLEDIPQPKNPTRQPGETEKKNGDANENDSSGVSLSAKQGRGGAQ